MKVFDELVTMIDRSKFLYTKFLIGTFCLRHRHAHYGKKSNPNSPSGNKLCRIDHFIININTYTNIYI